MSDSTSDQWTKQQSLYLYADAETRQAEGIEQAVTHSGPTWVEYATEYVKTYLCHHDTLFCDDVWASGLVEPASPRAFGQVMKTAIRSGWMVPTDQARKSVQSNNSLRQVYASTIYVSTSPPTYPTFEP